MIDYQKYFSARQFTQCTQATYRQGLDCLTAWLKTRDMELDKISEDDFREFLDSQKNWNHNSKYAAYCATRSYLRWKFGDSHPALTFKLKRKKTEPQRVIDKDQLQTIIDYLQDDTLENKRNRAIIALMVDTGLRAFEVCGLKMRHLHLKSKSCQVLIKGEDWEGAVFSKRTRKLLKTWIEIRSDILQNLNLPDPGTVFFGIRGHTPGKPITPNGLRHIFKNIGKKVGLEFGFSPHDLRRSFATISLLNGANTRLVQVGGRWSDIRLVERYSPKITARDMKRYFPMRRVK